MIGVGTQYVSEWLCGKWRGLLISQLYFFQRPWRQSAKMPSLPVNDTRKACAPKVIWYWCFRVWTHCLMHWKQRWISFIIFPSEDAVSRHFNCTTGSALYNGQCTVIVNGLVSTAIQYVLQYLCVLDSFLFRRIINVLWNNETII